MAPGRCMYRRCTIQGNKNTSLGLSSTIRESSIPLFLVTIYPLILRRNSSDVDDCILSPGLVSLFLLGWKHRQVPDI